jgi:hypothetical protein
MAVARAAFFGLPSWTFFLLIIDWIIQYPLFQSFFVSFLAVGRYDALNLPDSYGGTSIPAAALSGFEVF